MRASSLLRWMVGAGLVVLGFVLGQAVAASNPRFQWWETPEGLTVKVAEDAPPGTAFWVVASDNAAPLAAKAGSESLAMISDRPVVLSLSAPEVQSVLLYRLVPEAMLVRSEPLAPWTLRPCQSEVCPIPLPPPPPIRGFEASPGNVDPLTRGFLLHN